MSGDCSGTPDPLTEIVESSFKVHHAIFHQGRARFGPAGRANLARKKAWSTWSNFAAILPNPFAVGCSSFAQSVVFESKTPRQSIWCTCGSALANEAIVSLCLSISVFMIVWRVDAGDLRCRSKAGSNHGPMKFHPNGALKTGRPSGIA